jgi:hypothetical protein
MAEIKLLITGSLQSSPATRCVLSTSSCRTAIISFSAATSKISTDLARGSRSVSPWQVKSAGLGGDGAPPEVGWVPLVMDEPPVPWQLRGTLH